jgi:hypothetical protein
MTAATGASYSANCDGRKYECKGDPGVTQVGLEKLGEDSSDFREGQAVISARFTLGDGGRTLPSRGLARPPRVRCGPHSNQEGTRCAH